MSGALARPTAPQRAFARQALVVLGKELVDTLRDRRTLARLLLPALLMGPLLLMALSGLIASLEARAESRTLYVEGIAHAPTLRNYLERQTWTLVEAPPDYEAGLRSSRLPDPVVRIPPGFEAELARGERPVIEVVGDSSNQRAMAGMGGVMGLLQGFSRERAGLHLALRGVSTDVLRPVEVQERDLASTQARAARLTGIIPMFIIMAVLYGALTTALDSTAGERERGSLEPLLMNPVPQTALVLGKWGAVALLGLVVAALSSLSFLPGQWLLRSDSLQAMFQFGWQEALVFLALQVPLAAGIGGLLMAMAIRSRTFKEAQAGSTLVMTAVGLTPMVSMLNPGGEAGWYLWVPGLAQNTLMMLVLKGETLDALRVLPSVVVGLALGAASLAYVVRSMRTAVAR